MSGWQEAVLVACLTGVPVVVVLAAVPDGQGAATAALIAAAVAGVLLSIAALLFYFHWLTTPSRRQGWTTTTMVVLAAQMLVTSSLHLAGESMQHEVGSWGVMVDLLTLAIVTVMMVLGRRSVANPQPLILGVAVATALAVLHVLAHARPPLAPAVSVPGSLVFAVVLAGHAAIACMVLSDRSLIPWARHRLALTVAMVGVSHVATYGSFDGLATDLAAAAAQVGAAVLWASATFILLRDSVSNQHDRSITLEGSLFEIESTLRGNREQLHEIRSTLAGAASASRLLDDRLLGTATHDHLVRSISTELGRLERLVSQHTPSSPGPVDLDTTLDVLLESHRAQGRTVEWEPSGGTAVHARPDDVAEALNILLDNAAKHGGATSRVAVTRALDVVEISVSDEGPGIPVEAREMIFDWGVHSDSSLGEGIGLSVARRLVAEHGGTLTLRDPAATPGVAPGTAFVISLPAARRSEEDHARRAGH